MTTRSQKSESSQRDSVVKPSNALEEWRPVVGFEGRYEVSNQGRVFSLVSGRLLTQSSHTNGYKLVGLGRPPTLRKSAVRYVHRLVLAAFVGPVPDGKEGCHNDGDKANNRLENLRYDTHFSNCQDTHAHGTSIRGERHFRAMFTDDDIRAIRALRAEMTLEQLGELYDCSFQHIGLICQRKRWPHVV